LQMQDNGTMLPAASEFRAPCTASACITRKCCRVLSGGVRAPALSAWPPEAALTKPACRRRVHSIAWISMISIVSLKETSASTLPPSSVITNRRPVHCPASQGVVADQLTRASDSFVARLIEIGKLHGFPINDRAPFMLDVKVVPRHSMISDNLCNSVTD